MADAATPETGPANIAHGDVDGVLNLLSQEGADGNPDEPSGYAEAPSEAEPSPPYAGEEQANEADPDPAAEEPSEPTVRVKVRGEWREIPLSEAANGYSRTEDYKAKTAEVAREREALAAEKAEFTARARQLDSVLAQAPNDPILADGVNTDWVKLAEENPAEYVAKRAAYDARVHTVQQAYQLREQARQQDFAEQWKQAEAAMAKDFPEWRTPEGQQAAKASIVSVLREQGYTDAEIAAVSDPRVMRVAMLAAKAKDVQQARQSAEQKRAPGTPPKVLRPGTGNTGASSNNTRALLNRAQTSTSMDARVDALMALLDK